MTRRLRDLFVEPLESGSAAPATEPGAAPVAARAPVERGARARRTARPRTAVRSVAVLAAPARVRHAAAAVALALARTGRARCGLVHVVGASGRGPAASSPLPAAGAAAARLRRAGRPAVAVGRLVWVGEDGGSDAAEPEEPGDPRDGEDDGRAAARPLRHGDLAGALAPLADALGAPAVLGLGLARTPRLDDALAGYDGLVVVREPDATDALAPLVVESLAALGPAVAALPAPSRVAGRLAASGLHAPAAALAVVRTLSGGAP